MTKYRLIDTELQKNLDKISNNEFSNWLGRISPCVFPVTFKLNGRKGIYIWEPVNRFCGYFEGNKIYEYTDFPFEVKEGLKVRYRTWE